MSSLSRNRRLALRLAMCALILGAPGAWAQQTLFFPGVEAAGEWNSNRELAVDDQESSSGYRATLDARIRRITPRSDTELRPAVSYQKQSGRTDLDSVEGALDIRSHFRTLKGRFGLFGRFRRQDAFNAQLGQASFDGDPGNPDDVENGNVTGGITRTSAQIQPSFSYSVTERTDIEASVGYNYLNYDSDLPRERVGFTSPSVDLEMVRELTPRLRLGFGPYFSHYKADNDSNESDSYGAVVNLRWKTSEISRSTLRLRAERTEETQLLPVRIKDSATTWGIEWIGVHENRVGNTQYRIGRFLEPTSLGGRREVDQFRVQYERPFSRKTLLRSAVRYIRSNDIGSLDSGSGRDQAQADLLLRRFITEKFFVSGGYRFAWIDRDATGNAANHGVFISVGLRQNDPTGGFRE